MHHTCLQSITKERTLTARSEIYALSLQMRYCTEGEGSREGWRRAITLVYGRQPEHWGLRDSPNRRWPRLAQTLDEGLVPEDEARPDQWRLGGDGGRRHGGDGLDADGVKAAAGRLTRGVCWNRW
jgi:hypothetical protein